MSDNKQITLATLKEGLLDVVTDENQKKLLADKLEEVTDFVQENYTLNTEIDDVAELKEKLALAEEEVAREKAKKLNPHEARLQQINGGKELETLNILDQDEDGKILDAEKVVARFTTASFSLPKYGTYKAKDVMANPDQHAEVIQRLIERKSSVLVVESSKKLTKKELEKLNKNA